MARGRLRRARGGRRFSAVRILVALWEWDDYVEDVAYAVLSFGGFLGLGDKYFAIPWDALTVDTEDHSLILGVDKETLKNAPGFDKNDWPRTLGGDDTWLVEVYDYYGHSPYWR